MIPLRWKEDISATISLKGCIFSPLGDKDQKPTKMDFFKGQRLQSVQFRFRTAEDHGVLLYGQKDVLLALHDSKLYFKGQNFGHFLNDNRFHTVQLEIGNSDAILILDGMWREINGSTSNDVLDGLLVGKRPSGRKQTSEGYFKGCIRDLVLNKLTVELPLEIKQACQTQNKALLSFQTVSKFNPMGISKL